MWNIIFLDIDGVLNNENTLIFGVQNSHLDTCNFEWFKYTIKHIDNIKIVISSSWRNSNENIDNFLNFTSILGAERFKEIKQYFHDDYQIKNIPNVKRGAEIEEWVSRHKNEIKKYIILDDKVQFNKNQPFLHINKIYGFGKTEHDILISYFNGSNFDCVNETPKVLRNQTKFIKKYLGDN